MQEYDVLTVVNSWRVNEETGELYEDYQKDVTYLQPIDISSIRSRKAFESVVSDRVGKRKFKLVISHLLLDVVIEKQLSIPAISVLCFLGQRIGYNTMVYTDIKELTSGTGYTRQTVYSALNELHEMRLIKEPNEGLEVKGDRFVLLNPLYFFLGYYYNRDNAIKDWFKN